MPYQAFHWNIFQDDHYFQLVSGLLTWASWFTINYSKNLQVAMQRVLFYHKIGSMSFRSHAESIIFITKWVRCSLIQEWRKNFIYESLGYFLANTKSSNYSGSYLYTLVFSLNQISGSALHGVKPMSWRHSDNLSCQSSPDVDHKISFWSKISPLLYFKIQDLNEST